MRKADRENILTYIKKYSPYQRCYYKDFQWEILSHVVSQGYHRKVREPRSFSEAIIMLDTETSKERKSKLIRDGKKMVWDTQDNFIVVWTLSIRIEDFNLVTLTGRKPSEIIDCLRLLREYLKGDDIYIFIHNMSYDWTFIRKYALKAFGNPTYQLNTKPHYPIKICFENGLTLSDSLILAQRKLEKWAKDLNVEHKKAVGYWDYNKIRHQNSHILDEEWTYAECDTLAGVECIYATMQALGCTLATLPMTATGIPRKELQRRGGRNAHRYFQQIVNIDYLLQLYFEQIYHGGYTHGNRFYIGEVQYGSIKCYDFASSYPYCLLSEKYPIEQFQPYPNCRPEDILNLQKEYCCIFTLKMAGVKLKEGIPNPSIQNSKCIKLVDPVLDNGRVMQAKYLEIPITDVDLEYILPQYDKVAVSCHNVKVALKGYLPKWYCDYIYECFKNKCTFKGGDPVMYSIAKAKLNSLYGLAVQKPVKEVISEVYEDFIDDDGIEWHSGDFRKADETDFQAEFEAYYNKFTTILPYIYGVYCTAYATRNLFRLASLCEIWLYSDTDSCYGKKWNEEGIKKYNEDCIKKLADRGYGGVEHNGKTYYLGVAEHKPGEDEYTEFVVLGAKRYCGRNKEDGKLHITVAGVPKEGARCLHDNIYNFKQGFVFNGHYTGKLQHTYNTAEPYINKYGDEVADSIDLNPCDYTLDMTPLAQFYEFIESEVYMQIYE